KHKFQLSPGRGPSGIYGPRRATRCGRSGIPSRPVRPIGSGGPKYRILEMVCYFSVALALGGNTHSKNRFMEILLKAATIVSPENKELHLKKRDIAIQGGKIHKIAASLEAEKGTETLRFQNLHVSLGWFDSSVAFGEPGFEERETLDRGLFTAARAGFTDIVLSPNTHPLPDSSSDIVFLRKQGRASGVRLHPMGTVTKTSQGLELAVLYDTKTAGAVACSALQKPMINPNIRH